MESKSQPDELERIPRYNEILPFEPDEFVTAFTWAMNAASGDALIAAPTSLRLNIVDEEKGVSELHFTDTPLARITIAMQERYGKNKKKYYSAALRILALIEFIQSGSLASWIRSAPDDPQRIEVADSVVEAAAITRLTKQLHFPKREFLRKIKEIDDFKES